MIGWAFKLVGDFPERWVEIIRSIPTFGSEDRKRACELLEAVALRTDQDGRTILWSALTTLVNRHKAVQDCRVGNERAGFEAARIGRHPNRTHRPRNKNRLAFQ